MQRLTFTVIVFYESAQILNSTFCLLKCSGNSLETTFFAWEFLWKICLSVWGTAQILKGEYFYNWTEVEKVLSRYENFLQEYILCDLCFKWTFLQGKTAVLSKLLQYLANAWHILKKIFWKIVTRRLKFLFTSISGVQWQDETNIMCLLYL